MKVQVTESGTWRRTLEIEAPAEDVEKRLDAAYRKYSKTLNLPGFRKGKVPLGVVKKQFGPAIRGEVVQEMVEELYREASQSEGIQPVSQADIEDINFEEGQALVVKASVDVRPEIKAEHYNGLEVTRPVFPVDDAQIDAQLASIREQNAVEEIVERGAEIDDVILADVEELNEAGEPVPGTRQEDQRIRLMKDADEKPTEVAEQLAGVAADETRELKLKRPVQNDAHDHEHDHDHEGEDHKEHDHEGDDHEGDDHAPEEEEVTFRVTVKSVQKRTLPELDDELAKDVGEFETLDDLKNRIREDMKTQSESAARRRVEENIVDALIEKNAFEVPDSMVETYLDGAVESYKKEHAGHDHAIDEEAIRADGREHALRGVKRYLLLDAVASQEGIEVQEEDVEKHLETMSARHNIEGARLREILGRSGQLDQIQSDLQVEKTFDFLIENAKIEDVEEGDGE
ncbi:MAG: trigger factor [Candidatus Latescibacterota bacterium]|jgi:trigger factor